MSGVVFDPARAKVDAAYRTEAMELYKQGKLEISDKDLKWLQDVLATSEDDNEYQIEDDNDKQNNVKVIREKATDETHGIVDLAVSSTALGASAAVGLNAASGLSGWQAQMAGCNSAAAEIACITAFAVGTKYEITRPNKDEHKELGTLKQAMENDDVELANSLIRLQEADGEVTVLREEADEISETTEDDIKAKQEELEKKQQRIEELKTKSQTEEGLTEEEKAELETLTGEVAVLEQEIEDIKGKGAEDAEDVENDIEEKQDDIDEADEVFKSVLDVADYAATFDEQSKSSATIEAVAQGLNAAMGFSAAAMLTFKSPFLSLTPYGQILRGMALAGAAMSTHGTIEQGIFAKDIGDEIKVRTDIQEKAGNNIAEGEDTTEAIEEGTEEVEEIIEDLSKNPEEKPPETSPDGIVPPPADPPADGNDGDAKDDDDDKKEPPEV